MTKENIKNILESRDLDQGVKYLRDLPSPFGFKDMEKAVDIVTQSMRDNEDILLVGDYDVDGVSASAVVMDFFEKIGYKHIKCIIPNRFSHGYGISAQVIKDAFDRYKRDFKLILTVDNGITAFEAAQYCKENHIKLVITDHHEPKSSLPEADSIVDPKREDCEFTYKDICGSVVAWYFCAALKNRLNVDVDMSEFLIYLTLASIADVMPLTAINRIIVKHGLNQIKTSNTPLSIIIKDKLKGVVNAENLAFNITPILNCAGRMKDATLSLNFIREKDMKKSMDMFMELNLLNNERKAIQESILQKALDSPIEGESCVVAYGQGWHDGVLGIVCANLAQRYDKASFVLSINDGFLQGSGRSAQNIDLLQSIERMPQDILLEYGGHKGAMGIKILEDRISDFVSEFDKHVVYDDMEGEDDDVVELPAKLVNKELLEILESYEPYGSGNPKLEFCCKELILHNLRNIGPKQEHILIELKDASGHIIKGIKFFDNGENLDKTNKINISFNVYKDAYSGDIRAKIIDFGM